MSSEGSVHIHGRYDGAVKATEAIFVAEGAEVDATLTAETIIVAGVSRGTVRARGKFEVLPSGRVAGDINAPTLVVHEGAIMTGQLRMSGEEPTDSKPTSRHPAPRESRHGLIHPVIPGERISTHVYAHARRKRAGISRRGA